MRGEQVVREELAEGEEWEVRLAVEEAWEGPAADESGTRRAAAYASSFAAPTRHVSLSSGNSWRAGALGVVPFVSKIQSTAECICLQPIVSMGL